MFLTKDHLPGATLFLSVFKNVTLARNSVTP
jgi:hypothetical protein